MHAFYVAAINVALTEDDLTRADELAQAYDHDAIELVAARENKTHLLPIRRPKRREPAPCAAGQPDEPVARGLRLSPTSGSAAAP